jgi:hypothetical protein
MIYFKHAACFNAFIPRNNLTCDRHTNSYADPGLKKREQLRFPLFLSSKSDPRLDPATNPGLHRQSNLPQSLHRPWLLQSLLSNYTVQLQCLRRAATCRVTGKAGFFSLIVGLYDPQIPAHSRGTQRCFPLSPPLRLRYCL